MIIRGVNKVILIGNLGHNPEVRYTSKGNAISTISIATSENWKDKNTGEVKEKTEWHRIVFFGKLAEIAGEILKKGSQIYIEGQLQTRKWQDSNGNNRYITEIIVNSRGNMQLLGNRNSNISSNSNENKEFKDNTLSSTNNTDEDLNSIDEFDEEIQF